MHAFSSVTSRLRDASPSRSLPSTLLVPAYKPANEAASPKIVFVWVCRAGPRGSPCRSSLCNKARRPVSHSVHPARGAVIHALHCAAGTIPGHLPTWAWGQPRMNESQLSAATVTRSIISNFEGAYSYAVSVTWAVCSLPAPGPASHSAPRVWVYVRSYTSAFFLGSHHDYFLTSLLKLYCTVHVHTPAQSRAL